MKLSRIDEKDLAFWRSGLHQLEQHFTYPLGSDSFFIDHGQDYLAFFRRMGEPFLYTATEGNEVVAAAGSILHKRFNAWYLCDVKVHPDHRGKKIPLQFFKKYFIRSYLKSRKGFALTMEGGNTKNPILKIMETLPWVPLKQGGRMLFFYEDAFVTKKAMEILSTKRPHISFSSLSGIKDLVLKSSNRPIPLLHMEWGEDCHNFSAPQEEFLHMWCLEEKDSIVKELERLNILPKASGVIFQQGMNKENWQELRTSEL